MSNQIIPSELFETSSHEQLFTDFNQEEAAIVSGGQGRARSFLENRNFRNRCNYYNENLSRMGNRYFLTFTARCPVQI